ncbi:unnamed protein product [Adineta steineri]|uniref:ATP receptor n=2 Tax=Adineta steineri TaxID=433720 RepID=A0A819R566_9BILA|nr:unnamed protein product [Adineta steineri]
MASEDSKSFGSSFSHYFRTYSTVKKIKVHNTSVAILHRILQFVVLAYIAVYIVWLKKGYQDVQMPSGSSVIKVKGVARVSTDNSSFNSNNIKQDLWDAAEYLIPPIENNAFFIATRKTVTYDQTLSTCPSALSNKLFCNSTHKPCKKGTRPLNANGFLTGNCVRSQENKTRHVCEINAWCPEERSSSIHDYHIDLMALYQQGGLIEIQQKWKCNFDSLEVEKECFPTFTFNLLQSGSDERSPGINYRFAEKYSVNGIKYRTLTKIYGLRFIIAIRGKGRQFDIVHLFVAIGSGLGYMIIGEIICEFIFLKFHKYRNEYRRIKTKRYHLNQSKKCDDSTKVV